MTDMTVASGVTYIGPNWLYYIVVYLVYELLSVVVYKAGRATGHVYLSYSSDNRQLQWVALSTQPDI